MRVSPLSKLWLTKERRPHARNSKTTLTTPLFTGWDKCQLGVGNKKHWYAYALSMNSVHKRQARARRNYKAVPQIIKGSSRCFLNCRNIKNNKVKFLYLRLLIKHFVSFCLKPPELYQKLMKPDYKSDSKQKLPRQSIVPIDARPLELICEK